MRAALTSVRNAAAAARSDSRPGDGDGRPAPPRASVTDVVPRRTLIIGVVVVVVVLGTLLALAFSNGDSTDSAGKGGKDANPTAASRDVNPSSDAGQGSASDGAGGPKPGGTPGGGKDGAGGKKGGAAVPDGFAQVTNGGFHFAMVMPKGFKQTDTAGQNSGAIYSASGGFPRIQVDYNDSPGQDAAASWRSLEPSVAGSSDNYHLLGIKAIGWRGYPTVADWSFTRRQHGEDVRVLNRGFRADDSHGYAIMITCKAGAWDDKECRELRDTAFRTFAVKD